MKRVVGYAKLGRSWSLPLGAGSLGNGDVEVQNALLRLATRHPDIEFRLVGRNSGENPQQVGYPKNVVNCWDKTGDMSKMIRARERSRSSPLSYEEIDVICNDLEHITLPSFIGMNDLIIHAGQHGTSNTSIPPTGTSHNAKTKPYDSFILYSSYLVRNINSWRDSDPLNREEIWICSDARNYLKARDLSWPLRKPIIGQRKQTRPMTHYRYGNPISPRGAGFTNARVADVNWIADTTYEYGDVELAVLPDPKDIECDRSWDTRYDFGMILNENRKEVKNSRLSVLQEWVMPNWPHCEIFGKWSEASLQALGRDDIRPCPFEYVKQVHNRWKTTLTTPASGSGWATAKPWECFAAGTVCFFHPQYDDQNNILRDAPQELQDWLRVPSAEQLKKRVDYLGDNEAAWRWIIDAQREHFEQRWYRSHGGVRAIEERLGLL